MRRINIFTKIIGLNLGLTIFLAASITMGVNWFMSRGFEEQSLERLASNQRVVDGEIADSSKDMSAVAWMAAQDRTFAQAMASRDTPALQAYAKKLIAMTRVEFVTISDTQGTVLARGHSEKFGDSVMKQINVQKALQGETSTGIEPGNVIKFSLRAGQPVTLDGTLVGAITTGMDIASHSFVDGIKNRLGVACTIFDKDTRISTTIMKDGKRAVGTKMDNPTVLDTVLVQGKTFKARNTILGVDYDTLYWPIIDAGGKISGMYFIG
ncbi:MAG: cache domain-containing protein, partial [Desulfovibrionaceae bacterium]